MQCQQPYPTHQPLKPFELSCAVFTLPLYPLPCQFFFLLSIDKSAVHAISDTTSPHLEGYAARYRWYSRIFRPTNNIRLYLFAIAIPKYLEVRCYGQAYVISAFAYRFRSALLFPAFSYAVMCGICESFYLPLTSRVRREERIYLTSTCVCVAEDLECPGALYDRLRENCGRELRRKCGGERRGEKHWKLWKNVGDESPLRESRSISSRWTVRSRVSLANKNKANTYFRCCPGTSYLHSRNPVCTCIR